MNDHMNGDMTSNENIIAIETKLKHKITLYTADGSIDIKNQFHQQEQANFKLFVGQVLCGLKVLDTHGSAVIKLFGAIELYTISVIYLFSKHFQNTHIVKPMASRTQNDELYLVGNDFKTEQYDQTITLLQQALQNTNIVPVCNVPTHVIHDFLYAIEPIQRKRINKLNEILQSIRSNTPLHSTKKTQAQQLWMSLYCVKPIETYLTKTH